MRPMSVLATGLLAMILSMLGPSTRARADAGEIRLARQFSMGYLQFNVMERDKLIEKHARALGLGNVAVTWQAFNGPSAMNDALLSNSTDVVAGGIPGLLTLWNRTRGTQAEVRGISALSTQPFLLNTRNPNVRTIADFGETDRIAVPSVKVSIQAVALQMAAAKQFGLKNYDKLDRLTIALAPPDATVMLMNGSGEISSAFSVPPFQYQQLQSPGIHTVLSSFDVLGPHSFTVAWTSARFRDRNPVLYKALVAAIREATETVSRDRRAAAARWIEDSRSKLPLDMVAGIVSGPGVEWTMTPKGTMAFATFMHEVGTLKAAPGSWRDVFFPEIHDQPGD